MQESLQFADKKQRHDLFCGKLAATNFYWSIQLLNSLLTKYRNAKTKCLRSIHHRQRLSKFGRTCQVGIGAQSGVQTGLHESRVQRATAAEPNIGRFSQLQIQCECSSSGLLMSWCSWWRVLSLKLHTTTWSVLTRYRLHLSLLFQQYEHVKEVMSTSVSFIMPNSHDNQVKQLEMPSCKTKWCTRVLYWHTLTLKRLICILIKQADKDQRKFHHSKVSLLLASSSRKT